MKFGGRYSGDKEILDIVNGDHDKDRVKNVIVIGLCIVIIVLLVGVILFEMRLFRLVDNMDDSKQVNENEVTVTTEPVRFLDVPQFKMPIEERTACTNAEEIDGYRIMNKIDDNGGIIDQLIVPDDINVRVNDCGRSINLKQVIDGWMDLFTSCVYNSGYNNLTEDGEPTDTYYAMMKKCKSFCNSYYSSEHGFNNTAKYLRNVYTNVYFLTKSYYYSDMLTERLTDNGYSYRMYYISNIEKLEFDDVMEYASENLIANPAVGYRVVLSHYSFEYREVYDSTIVLIGDYTNDKHEEIKYGVYDFAPANILLLEDDDYRKVLLYNSYVDILIETELDRMLNKRIDYISL